MPRRLTGVSARPSRFSRRRAAHAVSIRVDRDRTREMRLESVRRRCRSSSSSSRRSSGSSMCSRFRPSANCSSQRPRPRPAAADPDTPTSSRLSTPSSSGDLRQRRRRGEVADRFGLGWRLPPNYRAVRSGADEVILKAPLRAYRSSGSRRTRARQDGEADRPDRRRGRVVRPQQGGDARPHPLVEVGDRDFGCPTWARLAAGGRWIEVIK